MLGHGVLGQQTPQKTFKWFHRLGTLDHQGDSQVVHLFVGRRPPCETFLQPERIVGRQSIGDIPKGAILPPCRFKRRIRGVSVGRSVTRVVNNPSGRRMEKVLRNLSLAHWGLGSHEHFLDHVERLGETVRSLFTDVRVTRGPLRLPLVNKATDRRCVVVCSP